MWIRTKVFGSAGTRDAQDLGLSPLQLAKIRTLQCELDSQTKIRAQAVGFDLTDVQLARYFETARWETHYSDGNSVLQSIINTVEWRESRGIWRLVTNQNARKARLWECLQSGICFTAGCDKSGRPSIFVNPAAIATIRSSSALNAVPDLVLYTVERAEVSAVNSGRHGKGMVVYIDCAGCGPSILRRFVSAILPCFGELATHYPDRLAMVSVLNTSRAVAWAYKVLVAPFLTAGTRAKVRFVQDPEQVHRALLAELGRDGPHLESNFDPGAYIKMEA
eukprot:CAMPEP_0172624066 /NCGR_PEP_ID=MMETSP1068-20121228/133635_1 /TAXON_ID=35684 /ORGANISM="Pseudopedinella elastica, Strain CCMP716" /LENGTH=277 /DNA_ID=CAMNT_0013432861 /DNA_START=216 /DNA_END=1049 /DNA_ORIENTATION=-